MPRYTDADGTQYLLVCPRGFANETTIYAVPSDKIAEAEAAYDDYENDVEAHRYANWLSSKPNLDQVLSWSQCPWSAGWK